MSGYLSNLLTNTTSRYNSLRRTLLSNEDDGDTEDDSHISRVLRAYYTEKGRPFPSWLPPDPNDKRAQALQPQLQQQPSYYSTSAGGKSQYDSLRGQNTSGQRGSLNDLWDSPASNPAPAAPQSLRAGRRAPGGARPEPASALAAPRPLPSQRAGSYQSARSQAGGMEPSPPGSSSGGGGGGGGGTAQERLKARLWGSRAASPAGSSGGSGQQSPYDPPAAGGGNNPYDAGGGGGGNARRYGRIT